MDRTHLLNRLWEYQHQFGYISDEAVSVISKRLSVSSVEVESVISFYHFFHKNINFLEKPLQLINEKYSIVICFLLSKVIKY